MNAYLQRLEAIGGRIEALARQKILEEIAATPSGRLGAGSGYGDWRAKDQRRRNIDVGWVTPLLVEYGEIHGRAAASGDAVADLEAATASFANFNNKLNRVEGLSRTLARKLSSWEEGAGEHFQAYYIDQLPFHAAVQAGVMDSTAAAFQAYLDLYQHVRAVGIAVAEKTESALINLVPQDVANSETATAYLEALGVTLDVVGVVGPKDIQLPVELTKVAVKVANDAASGITVSGIRVAGILEGMSLSLMNAAEQANQVHFDLESELSAMLKAAQSAISDAIPSYPPFTGD